MGLNGARRLFTVLFCLLALAGCATTGDGDATEFRRAAAAGFEAPRVIGPPIPYVAMAHWGGGGPTASGGGVLTVYIEGDGAAWSPKAPPDNPTPRTPVALDLALADPGTPVLYLGRPCQFMAWQVAVCPSRLWAERRFADEVITAMDVAVVAAMRRSGATRLVLVGFSGGAAVVSLLALRHPETVLLVTVAGVIDHAAWTRLHEVAPLAGSLNPADRVAELARIRQVHLVGSADRIVPPALILDLMARYGDMSAVTVEVTPNGHDCCWAPGWEERIAGLRGGVR